MAPPIRSYKGWNYRSSNKELQIEPYRHYYFICEGQNTECWYFEKFIDLKKHFCISSLISIQYLEKTGEHKNWSNPKSLIKLANEVKENGDISFDPQIDKIIIVFDADIYESDDKDRYNELVNNNHKKYILGVTNPSFELFLLLHYENSYNDIVLPHSSEIIENGWVTLENEEIRYIEYLFRQKSNLKPKKDKNIEELVKNVNVAIEQEKNLNNDIFDCKGKLTSNIGLIIKSIFDDKCDDVK